MDWYAIDFNLSLDSEVSAVLGGIAHPGSYLCTSDGGAHYYTSYIVWIDHGGGLISYYSHLDGSQILVGNGDRVVQGQRIALSDDSGDPGCSTGSHLHFAMHNSATTWNDGNAYFPEPMSGYGGFGAYGANTGLDSPGYTSSTSPRFPLVVDNGSFTFVADYNHLTKYSDGSTGAGFLTGADPLGLTGPTCPTYSGLYSCVGYTDMGVLITALGINSSYLFIGLNTGRVIKTNMCGTGSNVCAFDPNGVCNYSYSYCKGTQTYSLGSVAALAVDSTYVYASFGTRTVKTAMCTGSGDNMCYEHGTDGTCSGNPCYDPNNWIGYQDWAWPVTAAAGNDSYVFTSLTGPGVNRVCKTDLGGSGANIFYLSDWPSGCSGGTSPHWQGLQVMSASVVGLAADGSYVWWSLGATPRLIETDMCGSGTGGANMCEFLDGYGANTVSGYTNWKGRQDWCSGYFGANIASWNYIDRGTHSMVNAAISVGSGVWRIVKATNGTGVNMFTTDCSAMSGSNGNWQGYQDFNF